MTERALLVAAKAHPLLIRYSLRSVVNGPKTFWYKKKHELDLLFENYLLLVEKLGYTPPRLIVEQNIQGKLGRVVAYVNDFIHIYLLTYIKTSLHKYLHTQRLLVV